MGTDDSRAGLERLVEDLVGPAAGIVDITLFLTGEIELSQVKKLPCATGQFFGRPNWGRIFKQNRDKHKGQHIGVFLGNRWDHRSFKCGGCFLTRSRCYCSQQHGQTTMLVPKANTIKVQKEDLTLTTITQTYIDVGRPDKKQGQLSDLYGALNIGQSIIFVNSRQGAFDLAKTMKAEGHAVSLICGTQKTGLLPSPERIDVAYRDRVMSEFRSGVTKVLIATDVLSRGIDVPAVTLALSSGESSDNDAVNIGTDFQCAEVVNYELPMSYSSYGQPDFETYMHRIGRTGRFGLKGVAVNLVSEKDRHHLESIQRPNCTDPAQSRKLSDLRSICSLFLDSDLYCLRPSL
eukprot:s5002_g2.t2